MNEQDIRKIVKEIIIEEKLLPISNHDDGLINTDDIDEIREIVRKVLKEEGLINPDEDDRTDKGLIHPDK